MLKTLKQWGESNSFPLEEFLTPGDEIDEAMYEYFLGVLPPIYHSNGVFQVSEAFDHNKNGVATYGSYQCIGKIGSENATYLYLGNITKEQAKLYNKSTPLTPTKITIAKARKLLSCPCCKADKMINSVVCWKCWKNTPEHSSWDIGGFKNYKGSLNDFIIISDIPF